MYFLNIFAYFYKNANLFVFSLQICYFVTKFLFFNQPYNTPVFSCFCASVPDNIIAQKFVHKIAYKFIDSRQTK